MPEDNGMSVESLELQRQMLKETQRLRDALEQRQQVQTRGQPKPTSSKPIENKNKVGENRMGLPTPLPVVITDENSSDKKKFLDLIESLEKRQEESMKAISKMSSTQEKTSEATKTSVQVGIERMRREDRFVSEQRRIEDQKERLRKDRERLQDEFADEQTKRLDQIISNTQKKREEGLLARIIRARLEGKDIVSATMIGIAGKIKDDIGNYLRTSEVLQVVLTRQGKAFGKIAEGLKSDVESEERLRSEMKDEQKLWHEKTKGIFERSEELAKEEARAQEDWRRSTERLGGLGSRAPTGRKELDTFTEEEEEKTARGTTRLLDSIWREGVIRNKIFHQLTDPRSDKAMNVRLVSVKQGISLGPEMKKEEKKGEGLFDWLWKGFGKIFKGLGGMIKGVAGLFKSLALGLGGLLTKLGAGLGGGAVTGAVGLLGATAALGASLWTLKESVQTTLHLQKADREAVKLKTKESKVFTDGLRMDSERLGVALDDLVSHTTQGAAVAKEKGLIDKEGNKLSKEAIEVKASVAARKERNLQADIMRLEKLKKQSEEGMFESFGSFARKAGRGFGLSETFTEDKFRELQRLKKQQQLAKETREFYESEAEKTPTVKIDQESQKQAMKSAIVEAQIEIERTRRSSAGTIVEDPLLSEVRGLRKSLEKIYGDNMKEIQKTQSEHFTIRLGQEATESPLSVPDNIISRPPQAPQQMGTIKT